MGEILEVKVIVEEKFGTVSAYHISRIIGEH